MTPRVPRALAVGLLAGWLVGLAPAAIDTAAAATTDVGSVQITVEDVAPLSVPVTSTPESISFELTVTNRTEDTLTGVKIVGERGTPIANPGQLSSTDLSPESDGMTGLPISATSPVTVTLQPGGSAQTTFTTTISTQDDKHICQCANEVYPILFAAQLSGRSLGSGGTYLPVAKEAVSKENVSWVWPLIDRPHRQFDDTSFTDDQLGTEVASGGRLDRALSVIESVADDVPLTVVVDPETIDELAVMAAGSYTVATGDDGKTVAGTGSAAAAAWLARLHTVLSSDNDLTVVETPYADPDVESLTAHHEAWSTTMPADMSDRVRRALDGATVRTDVAWPAAPSLGSGTVSALTRSGTTLGLLPDTAVAVRNGDFSGVGQARAGNTSLPFAVIDHTVTALITRAVSQGADGSRAIPRLLAGVVVRRTAVNAPGDEVLAPDRYVDPDVTSAVRAIETTSSSIYTRPAALSSVAARAAQASTTSLRRVTSGSGGLPAETFDAVGTLQRSTGFIRSLLIGSAPPSGRSAARSLLAQFPGAIQRSESTAWRSSGGLSPETGRQFAGRLSGLVDRIQDGVHIVAPASKGSYTLASGNSALPVTVQNDLGYPVTINVALSAVGGVPGFRSRNVESHVIGADSKVLLHVPASLQRTGRLRIQASLTAADGSQVGQSVVLNVRGTSLGSIGIGIMVAAGALLVLALGRRWYRSAARRPAPVVDTSGDQ